MNLNETVYFIFFETMYFKFPRKIGLLLLTKQTCSFILLSMVLDAKDKV